MKKTVLMTIASGMLVLANTVSAETPTHVRAADGEMLDVAEYQLAPTDQFVRILYADGQAYVVVKRDDVEAYVIPIVDFD